MNLTEIIRMLHVEKAKVEHSIAALETLDSRQAAGLPPLRRRGRKSMGSQERREVSERMKRYWENRRQGQLGIPAAASN
jgi:hypothetical protein